MFLATVEDLYSRRMLGFAQSDNYPTAQLAEAALNMAAATRGGDVEGVIFHTDKGSQYTSDAFAQACRRLGAIQSMGRVGCALDNAAAESFFSTLEHERITRRRYQTRDQGPSRHRQLDRHLVQHQTPTLHQQHAQPDRIRTSKRSLTNPPRLGGKLRLRTRV